MDIYQCCHRQLEQVSKEPCRASWVWLNIHPWARAVLLVSLLLGFVVTADRSASASNDFREGLWEITATEEFIDVETDIPSTRFTQCLTQAEPVPNVQWDNETCEIESYTLTGSSLSWQLRCDTLYGEKRKEGLIHFSDTTLTGTITPGMSFPGLRVVSETRLEGKYIGECEHTAVSISSGGSEPTGGENGREGGTEGGTEEEEPAYRWSGTVNVRQKSSGLGTLTGVYDTSWKLQVNWKEKRRIDVRDERGRLVGQFVELVDDHSSWAGTETGSYSVYWNSCLYEGEISGEDSDTGRTIDHGWIYYSLVDDDPLAGIYPSGAYCFGGQIGLPSFTTHGFYRTTCTVVTTSNQTHPGAAMLGYFVGRMLLDPGTTLATMQVDELLGYTPPSYTKLGFDKEMRISTDGHMSGRYSNAVFLLPEPQPGSITMIVSWDVRRELDIHPVIRKPDESWLPMGEEGNNTIPITAEIEEDKDVEGKWEFTLYDVSNEEGYCMNAGEEDDFDFEFTAGQFGFAEPEKTNDGWQIETDHTANSATVTVQSRDYGA